MVWGVFQYSIGFSFMVHQNMEFVNDSLKWYLRCCLYFVGSFQWESPGGNLDHDKAFSTPLLKNHTLSLKHSSSTFSKNPRSFQSNSTVRTRNSTRFGTYQMGIWQLDKLAFTNSRDTVHCRAMLFNDSSHLSLFEANRIVVTGLRSKTILLFFIFFFSFFNSSITIL